MWPFSGLNRARFAIKGRAAIWLRCEGGGGGGVKLTPLVFRWGGWGGVGGLVKQRDNDAKVDFALCERKTPPSKFLIQFELVFVVNSLKAAAIPQLFFFFFFAW